MRSLARLQSGMRLYRGGIEGIGIDPVAEHADIEPCIVADLRAEQRAFVLADQQRNVGAPGEPFFLARQQPRLAPVEPDALPRIGIGGEFGRIDVAEIHHHAAHKIRRYILAHLARKDDNRVDRALGQSARDIAAQACMVERGQADRPAAQHGFGSCERQGFGAIAEAMARRQFRQSSLLRAIRLAFGEGRDMDWRNFRQTFEQMVRADLVSAIGRERDAVRQEQDVAHCVSRARGRSTDRCGWRCRAAGASTARSRRNSRHRSDRYCARLPDRHASDDR